MQTIKAQLAKIGRVRFLQLFLLAISIAAVLFGVLGALIVGVSYGLGVFACSIALGFGSLFVLAVAMGYNPNRREPPHIELQTCLKGTL